MGENNDIVERGGRKILVTCGTSLFESSCWGIGGLNETPLSSVSGRDLIIQRGVCREKIEEIIIKSGRLNAEDTLVDKFDDESWNSLERLRDLPAELASLKALDGYLEKQLKKAIGSGDEIILLYGDDNEGKFCATVINKVLKKLFVGSTISSHEVKNLDPTSSKGLFEALERIWSTYSEKFEDGCTWYLNLTGGYKISVIILSALSAFICERITIVYLHETAPNGELSVIHWDPAGDTRNKLSQGIWVTRKRIYVTPSI